MLDERFMNPLALFQLLGDSLNSLELYVMETNRVIERDTPEVPRIHFFNSLTSPSTLRNVDNRNLSVWPYPITGLGWDSERGWTTKVSSSLTCDLPPSTFQ
jgi:hypothetical protein